MREIGFQIDRLAAAVNACDPLLCARACDPLTAAPKIGDTCESNQILYSDGPYNADSAPPR